MVFRGSLRDPTRTPGKLTSIGGFRPYDFLLSLAALFIPVMIAALTRVPVRRTWLAVGLCLLFFVVQLMPTMASSVPHLIGTSLFFGLFFFVLFRFGFLACAASTLTMYLAHDLPITPDPSSWFFSSTSFTLGLIAALALYGFKIALPRRATVRDEYAN